MLILSDGMEYRCFVDVLIEENLSERSLPRLDGVVLFPVEMQSTGLGEYGLILAICC